MQVVKFVPGVGFETAEAGNLELESLNEKNHPNWFRPGTPISTAVR